jgi:hypothetical protein
MPLHRDNRDIIDARGRINDPKASILGILSIDLRGEKKGDGLLGRLGGI